jgi:hypothetical protein
VRDLSKRLRGGDFRQAVKAVAELRHLDRGAGAHLISSITSGDEQRAFQLLIARLVAESGVHGLAARWSDLPSPQWREMLVSEIGQAVHLWVDEGTIELLLAALLDHPEVARQAVGSLIECMRERPDKERKKMTKTLRGKAALDAWDKMALDYAGAPCPRRQRHNRCARWLCRQSAGSDMAGQIHRAPWP